MENLINTIVEKSMVATNDFVTWLVKDLDLMVGTTVKMLLMWLSMAVGAIVIIIAALLLIKLGVTIAKNNGKSKFLGMKIKY